MQSFSDYVGSAFVPVLNTGLRSLGEAFTTLESGATGWLDKIKSDPSVARGWDDLSTRVGADIKSIIGNLGNFDGLGSRPRILPLSVAPEWRSATEDIGNLVKGADSLAKVLDDINTKKITWKEILNFADLDWRIEGFKEKLEPLVDWSDRMAKWNPFGSSPPVDPKNPEGPTGPSVLDRLRALLNPPALHDRPPVVPPAPLPPATPFVLPKLGGMEQFKSPSQGGTPPMPRPAFSPIAFRPTDGGENPMRPTSGASASTSDAISTIAQGVRRGTYDALVDYSQMLKSMRERTGVAGLTPASFEAGSGGAGGLPSGSGGGGRPDDGAGAGGLPDASPAGRIGHDVRRQRSGAAAVRKHRRVSHTHRATSPKPWELRRNNIARSRPVSPKSRAAHTVKWAAQAVDSPVAIK
jgi:hypothetical protein